MISTVDAAYHIQKYGTRFKNRHTSSAWDIAYWKNTPKLYHFIQNHALPLPASIHNKYFKHFIKNYSTFIYATRNSLYDPDYTYNEYDLSESSFAEIITLCYHCCIIGNLYLLQWACSTHPICHADLTEFHWNTTYDIDEQMLINSYKSRDKHNVYTRDFTVSPTPE